MKRKILVVATVIATVMNVTAMAKLTTTEQKTSYALGYETGAAMKTHDITLQTDAYLQGLKEGLAGKAVTMTEQQVKETIIAFQKASLAKFKNKMQLEAKTNLKKGQDFLEKNAKEKGVITTKSGLQYKILTKGKGRLPTAKDTVTVDYKGELLNGKVFDSSYKRHQKATFPVSAVIKGWQEALTMMHVGSTWELYIPAKLAYGEVGAPGTIGPNETLVFKVQLYSIKK